MRAPGGALLLGACVAAAAFAFGSRSLAVVAAGLLLAAGVTRVWSRLALSDAVADVRCDPAAGVEGDAIAVLVEVRRASWMPVGSSALQLDLGRAGQHRVPLRGHGRRLVGLLSLESAPRGVYAFSDARLELGDHLGLTSSSVPVRCEGEVVVIPRVVPLAHLFSDSAGVGARGRRLLLRRAAGYDLHSVRAHEHGESLRRVHWPTSARRGELMVKELHDATDDDVTVLLDCDPAGTAGVDGESFDVAVRTAASLVRREGERGRTGSLLTTRKGGERVSFRSGATSVELDGPLRLLAGARPDADRPLAAFLERSSAVRAGTGDLVVVTGALDPRVVVALLDAAARRPVSVVWVDVATFVGRQPRAVEGALRITTAGIPVATVRRGDDLTVALAPSSTREVAARA